MEILLERGGGEGVGELCFDLPQGQGVVEAGGAVVLLRGVPVGQQQADAGASPGAALDHRGAGIDDTLTMREIKTELSDALTPAAFREDLQ